MEIYCYCCYIWRCRLVADSTTINQQFIDLEKVMVGEDDWMQTFSGKQFFPLKPTDICINDIAHSLSLICRFNGHCRVFYSVAEHSVRVSDILSKELALWGLLHDAAEAYIGDIVGPIKKFMWYGCDGEALTKIKIIEENIFSKIGECFSLQLPMPPEVVEADLTLLATEKRDLMSQEPAPWLPMPKPLEEKIAQPLSPHLAENLFIKRFKSLVF